MMGRRTLHAMELSMAIVGQTTLLSAALGFLAAICITNPLVPSDSFALLVYSSQSDVALMVTLIATVFSVASTTFLSIAFKEALRHRMHKSISLIELSSGVALARGSFIINFRHPVPALVTLTVFVVTKLLVSSWTALLTPTRVTWSVDVSGPELDLTSSWFESTLQQQRVGGGSDLVRGNSTDIFNLDGVLSGIAAAQYSFGAPGIFNFNGAQYNVSTGGILPAAPGYGGTTDAVSTNNTGLAFAGGLVPTKLDVNFLSGQKRKGLGREFTLLQQGLTAKVTCRRTDTTADNLNWSSTFKPIPVSFANETTDYWLWAWNITANCEDGVPAQQQYVTRSSSPTVQDTSSGFLSLLVCPYPNAPTGVPSENFTVIINATSRYSFLPLMACEINPLVTSSFVNYSNSVINTTVISSQPLGSNNSALMQFLAALVNHQSLTTQGLDTNALGDALYAIYVFASQNSTNPEYVIDILLRELELYWLGVIEFSGTFLRSAFSASPITIPMEAQTPVIGNETITSMGWYRRSALWGYKIIPIAVVASIMYAAVAYTLWHVFIERGHESFSEFDPSNPIQLMMVSSTRDRDDAKDNLNDWLAGFERGGICRNEVLRVQLTDVHPHRKRFRVTNS